MGYESLFTPFKIGNMEVKKPYGSVSDGNKFSIY